MSVTCCPPTLPPVDSCNRSSGRVPTLNGEKPRFFSSARARASGLSFGVKESPTEPAPIVDTRFGVEASFALPVSGVDGPVFLEEPDDSSRLKGGCVGEGLAKPPGVLGVLAAELGRDFSGLGVLGLWLGPLAAPGFFTLGVGVLGVLIDVLGVLGVFGLGEVDLAPEETGCFGEDLGVHRRELIVALGLGTGVLDFGVDGLEGVLSPVLVLLPDFETGSFVAEPFGDVLRFGLGFVG
jgi:hypothetical protein